MAAITVVKARHTTPVGYEDIVRGVLTANVVAGNLLKLAGTMGDASHANYALNPTNSTAADGIALEDGSTGDTIDVGVVGEMGGFSGLTPGPLYPSGSVAGGIDTTQPTYYAAATTPAVAVPARAQIKARTDTTIKYDFN